MLEEATDKRVLGYNPVRGVRLPKTSNKTPFYWTMDEVRAILRELDEPWRTLVDLDMHVGLRFEEIAGLRVESVDWQHGILHVIHVMTRHGPREHPKSGRSRRAVPIPAHLMDAMYDLTAGRPPDALVFTGAQGGRLHDRNFNRRVLEPAIRRAAVRRGTVHDMRHTAASHLAQAGVSLYEIQALLGHEDSRTTERYAHLAPEAFSAITLVWNRRTSESPGARMAHDGPEATNEPPLLDREKGL